MGGSAAVFDPLTWDFSYAHKQSTSTLTCAHVSHFPDHTVSGLLPFIGYQSWVMRCTVSLRTHLQGWGPCVRWSVSLITLLKDHERVSLLSYTAQKDLTGKERRRKYKEGTNKKKWKNGTVVWPGVGLL